MVAVVVVVFVVVVVVVVVVDVAAKVYYIADSFLYSSFIYFMCSRVMTLILNRPKRLGFFTFSPPPASY